MAMPGEAWSRRSSPEFNPSSPIPQLCDFCNLNRDGHFIHPLVRSIIIHFYLAYRKPYETSSGRLARTLFLWAALCEGYGLLRYIPLSRIFLKSKEQYLKAFLHTEQDNGDLTYFIVYHLRAIRLGIRDLGDYIEKKRRSYHVGLDLLKKSPWMNHRQRTLVQHALRHDSFIYTIASHKNSHQVAYQSARTDLLTLAQKGYLEKVKSGKKFHFIISPKLPKKRGPLKL